jgi:hypothetical protein
MEILHASIEPLKEIFHSSIEQLQGGLQAVNIGEIQAVVCACFSRQLRHPSWST